MKGENYARMKEREKERERERERERAREKASESEERTSQLCMIVFFFSNLTLNEKKEKT